MASEGLHLFTYLFIYLRYWGLNSGLTPLSHFTSPFFVMGFFKIGSCKLFAQAGIEL
jgi:hypothetical protein